MKDTPASKYYQPGTDIVARLEKSFLDGKNEEVADIFSSWIIREENHYMAVFKPPGILSQKDKSGHASILEFGMEYLRIRYEKPGNIYLSPIHRLDRPAGGIMLLAKTSKGAARLGQSFHDREVRKKYWVVTKNFPRENSESGELTAYARKMETSKGAFLSDLKSEPTQGYEAVSLRYQLLETGRIFRVFEVEIISGKFHQIRALMGFFGCPLARDSKYGGRKNPHHDSGIGLLAYSLEFPHPVREGIVKICVPEISPSDFCRAFEGNSSE